VSLYGATVSSGIDDQGATMRMVVQGITAFYVYGTKGIYYGNYTGTLAKGRNSVSADSPVSVNNEPPLSLLGYLNHSVYQTVLYSRDELDPCTEYTVVCVISQSVSVDVC
jgi:hypothetical protein